LNDSNRGSTTADRFVKLNLIQLQKMSIEIQLKKFKNKVGGVLKYGPLYEEIE